MTDDHSRLSNGYSQTTFEDSQLSNGHSQLSVDDSQLPIDDSQSSDEDSQLKVKHSQVTNEHSQATIEDSHFQIAYYTRRISEFIALEHPYNRELTAIPNHRVICNNFIVDFSTLSVVYD